MSSDPMPPGASGQDAAKSANAAEPAPAAGIANAIAAPSQTGQALANAAAKAGPVRPPAQPSWTTGNVVVGLWFAALIVVTGALVLGVQIIGKKLTSSLDHGKLAKQAHDYARGVIGSTAHSPEQAQAEELLERVAANDASAPDRIIAQSESWIGRTRRTPRANQLITTALNSHDLHVREAALQADLAMDGIPSTDRGLARLEEAVEVPSQRVWALWTLGAIGNRGVDPAHAAGVIKSYLTDSDINVRVSAVNGLAVLGSDETVPLLLDRFRNDPSPVVQEQAACGLAESGMYTHEQRMVAAATLVNWLDDPHTTSQQRTWALQALRDISGQNLGAESATWRQWFENSR